jgi:hypothetical protein
MTARCFGVVRGSIHTAASPLNPETVEMSLQAQSRRPVKRIGHSAAPAWRPCGWPAWRLKAVLNVLADA